MVYEVYGNYGGALFSNQDDAIAALWLLGLYHNIEIDRNRVKRILEKEGYFEEFPLAIIRGN